MCGQRPILRGNAAWTLRLDDAIQGDGAVEQLSLSAYLGENRKYHFSGDSVRQQFSINTWVFECEQRGAQAWLSLPDHMHMFLP